MALTITIDENDLANEFENDPLSFANLLDEIHGMTRGGKKKDARLKEWAAEVADRRVKGAVEVVNALHAAFAELET